MGNYIKYAAFRIQAMKILHDPVALMEEYNQVCKSVAATPNYKQRLTDITLEMSKKNRYMNIITFDDTRVKLTGEQDYINASYIKDDENGSAKYIATQGPMKTTFDDFWRMCWEQKTAIILMLSPFTEHGRVKVDEYLPLNPGESEIYDQVRVTTMSVQTKCEVESCSLRKLKLQHTQSNDELSVLHVHFTGWPDFGNAGDVAIIKLVELLQKEKGSSTTPIVTHCSAGVGRSGTFIAIDIIINKLKTEANYTIDVKKVLKSLRTQRPLMVMTPEQYGMIYSVIYYWLFGANIFDQIFKGKDEVEDTNNDNDRYREAMNKYI